ncbi:MAG: hypothetical protein CMO68_03625 [Verrucomicrobiales bacterium]|nr:hypothetical protein [Verrucomicrobiales bacterium]
MMTTILILGPFVFVWAVAALFYTLGRRRARQTRLDEITFARSVRRRLAPSVFSRPRTWVAVRSRNPEDVARSMGLDGLRPCAFAEASGDPEAGRLFVSPPVNGWVVVMGGALPDPSEDIDACYHFLADMSGRLGHLQFFHGNPALGHHAWAKLIERKVVRAYAWIGETVWNQGDATRAEQKTGMRCFDYLEDGDEGSYQRWETVGANVDRLPVLASIWSVDPVVFEDAAMRLKPGWGGRLPVRRSKKS